MKDFRPTRTAIVTAKDSPEIASHLDTPISIRVSPHSYFVVLLLGTFFSAFLFYIELDPAGVGLFAFSWIVLPFLALNDRIVFDGRRLSRTGIVPNTWAWLNSSRRRLKLTDIEQVETLAVRALKRGGKVFYRYRTNIRGKGLCIGFASGSDDFRLMIKGILPHLSDDVLDNRSIELRDHLAERKETLMRAEFSRIPSVDALENTANDLKSHAKRVAPVAREPDPLDAEKADDLRSLANELRLTGHLLQALEAFRRALLLRPADARLLFEFARCLQSFAGMQRDKGMERKALAAMRLAERRAANDGDLLARLGECYFQIGEWRRAGIVFQTALDRVGESFRSARGLAEIALREGKIAHVIHHFSTANRIAETPALRRWTKGETEYFSRLNSDDEYMEMEVGRVNLLETLESSKKTALRIVFLGLPAIFVGVTVEDTLIANIGWAVSTVSLLIWTGLIMSVRLLSPRLPYDLVESDD